MQPTTTSVDDIVFRQGSADDGYELYRLFSLTVADLVYRLGFDEQLTVPGDEELRQRWVEDASLYDYLAANTAQFWVAEKAGSIIGFARTVEEDGLRELTEFFVLPGEQSQGVGRELLQRTFSGRETRRLIIATPDIRAQVRYLKSGVYPRFPVCGFSRKPQPVMIPSELRFEAAVHTPQTIESLATIDKAVLEHRRDKQHRWLLSDRECYLYYEDKRLIGYGYAGKHNGPFALIEESYFPAVLAHAEMQAVQNQHENFALDVPMANQVAVDYLLAQGFKMDSFFIFIMTSEPFGHFEKYINTTPPLIL